MPRDTSFTPFRMLDSGAGHTQLSHTKDTDTGPDNGFMGSQPLRPQNGIHHMLRVTIMVRRATLHLSWVKNLSYWMILNVKLFIKSSFIEFLFNF